MPSIVKQSRLIFIDSELNGHPNAVVTFPSQPFSVCCSDHMRLTLLSFQMRRNWYSVNSTNNTFYILNKCNSHGGVRRMYDRAGIVRHNG